MEGAVLVRFVAEEDCGSRGHASSGGDVGLAWDGDHDAGTVADKQRICLDKKIEEEF